jgi:hypothetical protein
MLRRILSLLTAGAIIIVFPGVGIGQDAGAIDGQVEEARTVPGPVPPPVHSKQIYRAEDGKLYIARDLPVFFHISSTPDPGGALQLDGKKEPPRLVEGLNILRRSAGGKTPNGEKPVEFDFKIYADGTPPETRAVFSNAPLFQHEGEFYYGKGVKLKLTARDALSGVREMYLSVDGGVFKPLRGSFSNFPGDRKTHLRYYSVDHVGNAGKPTEMFFYQDVSPPRSRLTINGKHDGGNLSPGCLIALTSDDRLSGVRTVYYRIDNEKLQTFQKDNPGKMNISTDRLAEGKHQLVYYAEDQVGNREEARGFTFFYDTSSPESTLSILGDRQKKEGVVFVSGNTRFRLDTVDNIAGVAAVRYGIDSGKPADYSSPFQMVKESGLHTISFFSVDRIGNKSEITTNRFYMDITPPETEYEIGGFFARSKDEYVIQKEVEVCVTSNDLESGVKEIRYRINGGDFKVYTGPLSFEKDGEYELTYHAVDWVNNRENDKLLKLRVDNSSMNAGFQVPTTKYPKRWYLDEKGQLMGSTDLPFYLEVLIDDERFPGPMLMDTKKLSMQTGQSITFKKEGINYLRLDTGLPGQPPDYFKIFIDGRPPFSRPVLSGAVTFVKKNMVYYGPGLTLVFNGEDYKKGIVSGYKHTFVSINSKSFFTYTAPIKTFALEKIYNCRFYSVDNVGNAEKERELIFTVDMTPPVTTRDITGVTAGRIVSSRSRIKLSSVDNLAGVKTIYYRFDDQQKNTIYRGMLGAQVLSRLSDGEHTMYYFAEDNTGNREHAHELSFCIDNNGPAVKLKVFGDLHQKDNTMYVSERTRLGFFAADGRTGVESVKYRFDGGPVKTYDAHFAVPGRSGEHRLSFWGVDGVENTSKRQTQSLFLDTVPPITSLELKGPFFNNRYRSFVSSRTALELNSDDGQSGLDRILYRIGGEAYKEYSKPFRINSGGLHTIEYYAVDRVNNSEKSKKTMVFLDKTPPVLDIIYNVIPKKAKDGLLIFPKNVLISIIATDEHTEVDKIVYQVNGGKERLYRNPLSEFEAGKTVELKVMAVDRLSNRITKTIKFQVR